MGSLFILHIHRFSPQHIGHLVWGDVYLSLHEFGNVVAAHELAVIVGVGSGQLEGLGSLAVFVDVGNERAGVGAVVSTAADDYPAAIARP